MPGSPARVAGDFQKALSTFAARARDLEDGYMLCEDLRPNRQDWRSRFTVRALDRHNLGALLIKGIHVVTSGEAGPNLSPEPLLRKAANETDDPERKAYLLAEADRCAFNMAAADHERKSKKPTREELEAARQMTEKQVIADGLREGFAEFAAAMRGTDEPQKRGPGRPRKADSDAADEG